MKTQVKENKEYRRTLMKGDKIIKGVEEIKRIMTGEKCEICRRPLEQGSNRLCFSCEVVVYG